MKGRKTIREIELRECLVLLVEFSEMVKVE
jgi:hypothetical protein